MRKIICDICEKEIDDSDIVELKKNIKINNEKSYSIETIKLELCNYCMYEIKKKISISEAKIVKKALKEKRV